MLMEAQCVKLMITTRECCWRNEGSRKLPKASFPSLVPDRSSEHALKTTAPATLLFPLAAFESFILQWSEIWTLFSDCLGFLPGCGIYYLNALG